ILDTGLPVPDSLLLPDCLSTPATCQFMQQIMPGIAGKYLLQACLRPRDRFWDIPVPKIDSAFDNLFVPQPSWSPSTTQQLRKLVAAPYLSPNDWTPRLNAYFASPLALCARRVSSAASRLLGSTSHRFALHGWQRTTPNPSTVSTKTSISSAVCWPHPREVSSRVPTGGLPTVSP
ncbi:hypothetical protein, partial [Thiolapillus sp.]|uniref:hypothetical protein n=1 Tax=Thiolapillus sp. TaxID=2017437 RepID=UPI003AF9216B